MHVWVRVWFAIAVLMGLVAAAVTRNTFDILLCLLAWCSGLVSGLSVHSLNKERRGHL